MAPPFFYLKCWPGNMSQKYPSLNVATHYCSGNYYKVGEEICFVWLDGGWAVSLESPGYMKRIGTPLGTAPEAQQRTQKLPATPAQGGCGIVDYSAAHVVLNPYLENAINLRKQTDGSDFKLHNSQRGMESRKAALEALVRDNEELGLYDMPLTPSMTEKNDNPRSTTSANNRQVGGDHYKKMKIQPWDIVDACFTSDQAAGFYIGNVLKYLLRFESKSGIQDLEKAKHYLEKLIEVKRDARH